MSEETTAPTRKRRTVEEIRAFHEAELKKLAEREKAELLKLLSGVHDDLAAAATHPQAKPFVAALAAALTQTKAALAALDKK